MKLILLRKELLLLVFFWVIMYNSIAQPTATDSTVYAIAIANATESYHHFFNPETGLYNGSQYHDYSPTIKEGDPFFMTTKFNSGTVVYDGILYKNVPILYDLVTSDVVITDSNYFYRVKLNGEHVSRFTVLGHTFLKLNEDSSGLIKKGFYDVLYDGKIKLYKRHLKRVQESVTTEGVTRYIVNVIDYYLWRNGDFYHVNRKKELLKVLSEKKRDINSYIKKNKLDTRKHKDESFTAVAAYYDGLSSNQ